MDDSKQKALASALGQIEKQFGRNAVMRMGDRSQEHHDVISTGSIALDAALGVGGLPRGRIVEIFGPESSGKTTLALEIIAQAQQRDFVCAIVDAEHALSVDYADKLGLNVDELLVSQPDTGEQALEITDMLVRSNAVDVIVIDSVAALVPKAEIEGDMGKQLPGLQARLLSQGLRKLTAGISQSNTLVIFINQIRMKIGVMFGSPEVTCGGQALRFYSSVRLDIRGTETIRDSQGVAVGRKAKVRVVKNKVAAPFRVAEFLNIFGEGIDWALELIQLGVEHGLVEKAGTWYSYSGLMLGQGTANAAKYLEADLEVASDLDARLRAALFPEHGSIDQLEAAGAA